MAPRISHNLFLVDVFHFMKQIFGKAATRISKIFHFERSCFVVRTLWFLRSWSCLDVNLTLVVLVGAITTQHNPLAAITALISSAVNNERVSMLSGKLHHNIISFSYLTLLVRCCSRFQVVSSQNTAVKSGRYRNILLWCFRHCPALPAAWRWPNLQHCCRHQGDEMLSRSIWKLRRRKKQASSKSLIQLWTLSSKCS